VKGVGFNGTKPKKGEKPAEGEALVLKTPHVVVLLCPGGTGFFRRKTRDRGKNQERLGIQKEKTEERKEKNNFLEWEGADSYRPFFGGQLVAVVFWKVHM